jgi:AcrR family transcriptional regulator
MRISTKSPKPAESRGRGRPRGFDPEVALDRAREVFWDAGYAASSLDELSEAMQLNRPSVYAAFGDKEALYLETLGRYRDAGADAMVAALDSKRPLQQGVRAVYAGALALYFANKPAPRGCFLIGTAATEAVRNPKVRDVLGDSLLQFDRLFEKRFAAAREQGEIGKDADPAMLARLASSVMFSLAVRARAGESRRSLEALADAGAAMVCGAGLPKR